MAKRLISLLLVMVLVAGILPVNFVSATQVEDENEVQEITQEETTVPEETTAPEETTEPTTPPQQDTSYKGFEASDECIRILKLEEGFSKKPYWDYSQYTVGFGTKCPDDMLEYYSINGITEKEAEMLLRNHLIFVYKDLVAFMERNSLTLTQNQFDALVLMSYNCGTSWSFDKTGTLYKAIVNQVTGSELIRSFAVWCIAGGSVKDYLLRRRLSESNMYLNGVYSQTPPANYCYVYYNANGGSVSPKSQGYDSDLTAAPFSVPTYSGYTFTGWYTAASGGTKVTVLDASTKGKTLYAHWENGEGQSPEENVDEVDTTVTVTEDNVNLRKGPGTNYTIVGTANKGQKFHITAVASGSGYTWGKYDGGWVCLKFTNYGREEEPEETIPEETTPEATTPPEDTGNQQPETTTAVVGKINANGGLNVRKEASTGSDIVRCIPNGTKVEILEQKTVGATVWGKISDGWISMKYVKLGADDTESEPEDNTSNNNNNNSSTATVITGTIKAVGGLNVRSGAGVSYPVVGNVANGAKVQITETKKEGSTTWGKITNGWISMAYVVTGSNTGSNTGSTEQTKPTVQTGTIKVSGGDNLRGRSGAGTSFAVCGYLNNGATVQITETKTVGSTVWGKIANGWISMDYVVLSGSSQPNTGSATKKTVNASCLCVRSGAGTTYDVVGYLYNGSKVEILETKTVGGVTWGRIFSGWICMDYVK